MYWRSRDEPAVAKDFFERALAVADTPPPCHAAAGWTHHHMAELAHDLGDNEREREHYWAAVGIGGISHDDVLTGWSLINGARCAERSGETSQAGNGYALALEIGTRISHQHMIREAEEGLARLADGRVPPLPTNS